MVRWQFAGLLGLAASVAITGLALVVETGRIEADVAMRARDVLNTEATSWARFDVSGRRVNLSGAAPTPELRELAVERVERLSGIRSVDAAATTLLPERSPYRTTLSRRGGAVTIAGFAPSRPDRNRMVEALTRAVPDLAYNDDLELARGMPDKGHLAALDQMMPLVALLRNGEIVVEDRRITITGEATSNSAYDRLRRIALVLPADYVTAGVEVTRPTADPFLLSVEIGERSVVLSGFAPDPDARGRILSAARANTGGLIVRDGVGLAHGAPEGFTETAVGALDYVDLMANGRIDVRDGVVSIQAEAASPEAYRTLNSHLATWVPEGYVVEAMIGLPVVSPFTLSAARDGRDITVTGFVPSAAAKDAVQTAAEQIGGVRGVVVETTLAAGAPDGFADAASFAVDLLRHVGSGTATIVDDRIALVGTAGGSGALLEIDAAVASAAPAGFTVTSTVLPPTASPYTWSLERKADSLVITGYAPNEMARVAIREAVEAVSGDLGVVDRSTVASGLPVGLDLEVVARFAARETALLDEGSVTLVDDELSVRGRTADALAGHSVRRSFKEDLPAGLTRGEVTVQSPPTFHMRVERRGDALAVQGTVDDEAMARALRESISRSFGSRTEAALEFTEADGLPAGAAEAALVAVRAASLLESGTVTIEGPVIQVIGKAFTGTGAVRLSSDIAAAVPSGFRLDTSIGVARRGEPLDPAACEAAFDRALRYNEILFHNDGAEIDPASHGLLDQLGAIALRCRGSVLSIVGFAEDGVGPSLAEARARALATNLEQVGVKPERIRIPGAGAGEPAAAATPEGSGRDARIDIRVEAAPATP